jgi:hypothetical protein
MRYKENIKAAKDKLKTVCTACKQYFAEGWGWFVTGITQKAVQTVDDTRCSGVKNTGAHTTAIESAADMENVG